MELHYIKTFIANKCKHFEGIGSDLWSILVIFSALKGLPSVPCGGEDIFVRENRFLSNRGHKIAVVIDKLEEYDDCLILPLSLP